MICQNSLKAEWTPGSEFFCKATSSPTSLPSLKRLFLQLLPWHVLTTLCLQLCAAASAARLRNLVHLDSLSPASSRMLSKFCLREESKILQIRASAWCSRSCAAASPPDPTWSADRSALVFTFLFEHSVLYVQSVIRIAGSCLLSSHTLVVVGTAVSLYILGKSYERLMKGILVYIFFNFYHNLSLLKKKQLFDWVKKSVNDNLGQTQCWVYSHKLCQIV